MTCSGLLTPSNFTRPRSHSASEVTLRAVVANKTTKVSQTSTTMYDDLTPSPITNRSHASESGSPTMEQAILMGCKDKKDFVDVDYGYGGSFASTSPDYNLEELVRALRLKHGVLEAPPPPSPPESFYRKSPSSLFGAELLKQSAKSKPVTATRRPKLPSISEQDPTETHRKVSTASPP